ncbi:MAG: DUF2309 domain-containing protein [Gammaproteobacteria bacterium]
MQPITAQLRDRIADALDRLDHVLPAQAPILDFVHHNTLHGFQHLPFEEALQAFESLTGISGYLAESRFREFYRQGRITESDLKAALLPFCSSSDARILNVNGRKVTRQDIYRVALLFDLEPLSCSQFEWRRLELGILDSVQPDVPEPVRSLWLAPEKPGEAFTDLNGRSQAGCGSANPVRQLWESIVHKLEIEGTLPHPEDMLDLSQERAEEWLLQAAKNGGDNDRLAGHQSTRRHAAAALDECLAQVGETISLRGFVSALCGIDIFDFVRPLLVRVCASALDQGLAPWRMNGCAESGLYSAWRRTLSWDANPFLHELSEWPLILEQLQEDAVDTIIVHLSHLEIPEAKWAGYLQRLALELPGWSGMINWRQQYPGSAKGSAGLKLADYLAIRLTLDRIWLNRVCGDIWKIEAKMSSLESYFHKNLSEFIVRKSVFRGELPEYLMQQAQSLIDRAGSERHDRLEWQRLSDRIRTWKLSPLTENGAAYSLNNQGWRLFRLCQHLGLRSEFIDAASRKDLSNLLKELDGLSATDRKRIWLAAYERNYREKLLQALRANRHRGRWARRDKRPEAQIVCCMDEREESFRRHLEELNPAIETLGAAGFFGVPINYKGLDEDAVTPLCPVVIKPTHQVNEIAKRGEEKKLRSHRRGQKLFKRLAYLIHHSLRRDLVSAHLKIDFLAPFTLIGMLADHLFPKKRSWFVNKIHHMIKPPVVTELLFDSAHAASEGQPRLGFTDNEQAERVEAMLRTMGLTDIFAPIVCMIAHGSTSLNNPHEAAHDCGACGGRRGGPNARVFAAMANRPEVRQLLAQRGIKIPPDSWFVGAQHDTCSDAMIWYDLESLPSALKASFDRMRKLLGKAQQLSAHERCRRFFSAEEPLSPFQAYLHVQQRADDTSQIRPEFGHATNASAFIGRRSATQGLFLDRRMFLISYDAAQDTEGTILENILLTAGPVGAGINLEYYFSTIDNDRFGCGTKIPHNITGLFGVMEGASSDLRTGLPLQMVEIHEAMRLQVVVEAKTSVLEQIYHRQDSLRELIAGGWIYLSAMDPETGDISIFERGTGFVSWQAETGSLPVFENSRVYYQDQTQPMPPVLIRQPETAGEG